MLLFRIAKQKYINDLSGTGARLYGGRWNPKGYAMLYNSENRALAALEVLVHLSPETIPADLKILTISISDGAVQAFETDRFQTINELPDAVAQFQEMGRVWLNNQSSVALKVPSVLIEQEANILLNPLHPDFSAVKIIEVNDFTFDERFFG
ncbi:MAG: RES family NAD+ phosphorylase [Bacteroidota bacterium]